MSSHLIKELIELENMKQYSSLDMVKYKLISENNASTTRLWRCLIVTITIITIIILISLIYRHYKNILIDDSTVPEPPVSSMPMPEPDVPCVQVKGVSETVNVYQCEMCLLFLLLPCRFYGTHLDAANNTGTRTHVSCG